MNHHDAALDELLDDMAGRLTNGRGAGAIDALGTGLNAQRRRVPVAVWQETLIATCRQHPLHDMLLEDPYTRRAFEKPRGYAGDAVMLDYIYSGEAPPQTSPLGRRVFLGTIGSPNGRSVIARRDRIAQMLDYVATVREAPRILAIACGHLREAQQSIAVQNGRVGTFFALDQDAASLAVVEREQSTCGVRTLHAALSQLLRGDIQFEDLDFVYSTGLLDYLPDPVAATLMRLMFDQLAPGGTLLVTNFVPDNHGRGYMEAFMDWRLICRDAADMQALAAPILMEHHVGCRFYHGRFNNVIYLELSKQPSAVATYQGDAAPGVLRHI